MKRLLPLLILCLVLWSSNAMASTIIAIADSNINAPTNFEFFENVFSGQQVLSTSETSFLLNHTDMVAGYADSLAFTHFTLTTALLAGYDWVMVGGRLYTTDEQAALASYVNSGGNLWVIAESLLDLMDFSQEANYVLSAVGSSMEFLPIPSVENFYTSGEIADDPLTDSVYAFSGQSAGEVMGGTALVSFNGHAIVAYETIGTTTVPEPSTFALAALGLLGLVGLRRRLR